jgi:hypothetical protein
MRLTQTGTRYEVASLQEIFHEICGWLQNYGRSHHRSMRQHAVNVQAQTTGGMRARSDVGGQC